jgi:hypothetical protein
MQLSPQQESLKNDQPSEWENFTFEDPNLMGEGHVGMDHS